MLKEVKKALVLLVIQTLISYTLATVYTDCSSDATVCDGTTEACTGGRCACDTNYINGGTGTCVSSVCSSTACTATNTYCNTNSVCVCDALSTASTATDATLGACIAKVCTGGGTECDSITNAKCSETTADTSGTCICNAGYTLTEGVCAAQSSAGMVAASFGALLFALLLKVSLL